jgi:hypothetical protein
MTCNACEQQFQGYQPIVVSLLKSGSTAYLYLQNHGRNIVLIRRILLCYTTPTGAGVLYLRPPGDPISWSYPSAYLETGIYALFFQINAANVEIVQAQAEYLEITGRSLSCAI